jgi:hypothetical protein
MTARRRTNNDPPNYISCDCDCCGNMGQSVNSSSGSDASTIYYEIVKY